MGIPMPAPHLAIPAHLRTPASAKRSVLLEPNVNLGRFSFAGSIQDRGSAIGAKDTRNMNDKSNKEAAIGRIQYFLKCQGMDLNRNQFPLNTDNFKVVFLFMARCIDWTFHLEKKSRLEQVLPPFIERIGYTTKIPKSAFQTLGTPHSWTSIIGLLDYMVGLAGTTCTLTENFSQVGFQKFDEQGFVDEEQTFEDELVLDLNSKMFRQFQSNNDNFDDHFAEFEGEMAAKFGIDESERLSHRYKELCQELRSSGLDQLDRRLESATGEKEQKEVERNKLIDYLKMLKHNLEPVLQKWNHLNEAITKQKQLVKELASTKEVLTQRCLTEGKNPSVESLRLITELKNQLKSLKEEQDACETESMQIEIQESRYMHKLRGGASDFNTMLINIQGLGLVDNVDAFRVDADTLRTGNAKGLEDQTDLLYRVRKAHEQDVCEKANFVKRCEKEIKALEKKIQTVKACVDQKREKLRELEVHFEELIAGTSEEDAKLTAELEMLKEQLMSLKDDAVVSQEDVKKAKAEKAALDKELERLEAEKEESFRAWKEKLNTAQAALKDEMTKAVAKRNEGFAKYKEAQKKRILELKRESETAKAMMKMLDDAGL